MLMRAVVDPTAASASLPENRPTTMISTALNISCRIPDSIKGSENEISLSMIDPLHMSISYLLFFTSIFLPKGINALYLETIITVSAKSGNGRPYWKFFSIYY
jgi:hypothetical protein